MKCVDFNFRKSKLGKLILIRGDNKPFNCYGDKYWHWRDATTEDLKIYWSMQNEKIDISVDTNFNIDQLLG